MRKTRVLTAGLAVIGLLTSKAYPVCPAGMVYTSSADFELGTRWRVNADAVPDQLQLDPPPDL
jgi:hypothetical protein